MHYEVWTPDGGRTARGVFRLVEALSELVELTVVSPRPPSDVKAVRPDRADPSALRIYHFGADHQAYGWMYESLLAAPGVVVLHDRSLLDFYVERCGGIDTDAFAAEVEHAHGPIRGWRQDPTLISGWPTVEVDGMRRLDRRTLTLRQRVVDAAKAVVVHDPATARLMRAESDRTPIYFVPPGADVVDDMAARSRLGYPADEVVFTVLDDNGAAAMAFDQVNRIVPTTRLVAGESSPHLNDLLSATDVLISLDAAQDATIMQALGTGTVVVTTDQPRFRHLDPAFCRRLPVDPVEQSQALVRAMLDIAHDPAGTRAAGSMASQYVSEHASWPVVAQAHAEVAADAARGRRQVRTGIGRARVNVLADLRADTGLAEAARRHACALLRAGADMTVTEVHSYAPHRTTQPPAELLELPAGKRHPIDLWTLNLSEFVVIPPEAMDRYTVAIWAWEMPDVYDVTLEQLDRLDELWVVSEFTADAFRAVTDKPITVIGNVVDAPDAAPDRAVFGLPQDAVIVLFSFSALSSDARKNPYGVIDAFRHAFEPAERGRKAHLVIKAVDLDDHPAMKQHLATEVASVNGTLISGNLTRREMDCLLATCDIYVSLHRSEGFGFGIAEAMSLGKPVIATGYGGNTDFMPYGAGITVGYTVREITDDDHRFSPQSAHWYTPGRMWAEPNVEQAAEWLRLLADRPDLRERVGRAGAESVGRTCSTAAVGERMLRRLGQIDPTRTRYRT